MYLFLNPINVENVDLRLGEASRNCLYKSYLQPLSLVRVNLTMLTLCDISHMIASYMAQLFWALSSLYGILALE